MPVTLISQADLNRGLASVTSRRQIITLARLNAARAETTPTRADVNKTHFKLTPPSVFTADTRIVYEVIAGSRMQSSITEAADLGDT